MSSRRGSVRGSPNRDSTPPSAEAGDPGDPVPLKGEHEQPGGARDGRVWVLDVMSERGLGVCARGHQAVGATAARENPVFKKCSNRRAALVLVGLRGHRRQGVVGEQRHHAVDVVALKRVGEARDELTLAP